MDEILCSALTVVATHVSAVLVDFVLPVSLKLLLLYFTQLGLQFSNNGFVLFNDIEVLEEGLHALVVGSFLVDVWHLDVESNGNEIKDIFFLDLAKFLHLNQKIVFFCEEVVVFNVVD